LFAENTESDGATLMLETVSKNLTTTNLARTRICKQTEKKPDHLILSDAEINRYSGNIAPLIIVIGGFTQGEPGMQDQ